LSGATACSYFYNELKKYEQAVALLQDGLIERSDRLLVLLQLVVGPAKLVVGLSIVRVETNGLAISVDGFVVAIQAA